MGPVSWGQGHPAVNLKIVDSLGQYTHVFRVVTVIACQVDVMSRQEDVTILLYKAGHIELTMCRKKGPKWDLQPLFRMRRKPLAMRP